MRRVYKGKLTYSVNFDSHDSFTFGDCLDVIGMNTYDPIAKHEARPTPGPGAGRLVVDRQQGAHPPGPVRAPGDDHRGGLPQRRRGPRRALGLPHRTSPATWSSRTSCWTGRSDVLRNWSDGAAVFYYLYGENLNVKPVGGPEDRTYAVWGKPAEATLRAYFALPIFEGQRPLQAKDRREAVVQSLVSGLRKVRDYEDADAAALGPGLDGGPPRRTGPRPNGSSALEPRPLHKIPKGRESPIEVGSIHQIVV